MGVAQWNKDFVENTKFHRDTLWDTVTKHATLLILKKLAFNK